MYFNVNFNVFFKLIKVHFLVTELYIELHLLESPLFLVSLSKLHCFILETKTSVCQEIMLGFWFNLKQSTVYTTGWEV